MTSDEQPKGGAVTARSSLGVVAAFASASLLGFVLLGILARWLSPDQNAQFLAVWGLVFGFGSALSAIEQEIVRVATRARLAGTKVPLRTIQVTGLGLGVALGVLAVFALLPGVGAVLRISASVLVLSFVAVGGFAMLCLSRGVMLGTGQMGRYIAVVVAEAGFRTILAAAFLLGRVTPSVGLATATIVIGCFGWVPVIVALVKAVDWRGRRDPVTEIAGAVGALGAANGLSAMMLTGFPTLVTVVTGSAAGLATLFGAVTLARLPLVALGPVQALAVPIATRLVAEGRAAELRRLMLRIGALAWAAALLVAAGGWLLGPWGLRVYMGEHYRAEPWLMALLLASSCVIAAALLQVAALVAMQRYRDAVVTWLVTDLCAIAVLAAPLAGTVVKGAAAFASGSVVAWLVSALLVLRAVRRQQTPAQAPNGQTPADS